LQRKVENYAVRIDSLLERINSRHKSGNAVAAEPVEVSYR
jgi:hypothetical protein